MGFKAALAAFPAKRLIENNYYRTDFHMQVLADKLHLNRAYLRNIFSEYEHVSPKLYLVTARMTHARAFLEDADMPIHFVANSVGYEDPLQFTKTTNPYNPTQSSAACGGIFSAVSDVQYLPSATFYMSERAFSGSRFGRFRQIKPKETRFLQNECRFL